MSNYVPTVRTATLWALTWLSVNSAQALDLRAEIDPLARQLLADELVVGFVVGIYKDGETQVIGYGEVAKGKLMVQATGQQKFQVYPKSKTKFFYKVVNAQLTFVTDKNGKAEKLILHQNGVNQVATRQDAP